MDRDFWPRVRRTAAATVCLWVLFGLYSFFITPLLEGPYPERVKQQQAELERWRKESEEHPVDWDSADSVVLRWGHPEDLLAVKVAHVHFHDSSWQEAVDLAREQELFRTKEVKAWGLTESMLRYDVPASLGLAADSKVQDVIQALELPKSATFGDAFQQLSVKVAAYQAKQKFAETWTGMFGEGTEPTSKK